MSLGNKILAELKGDKIIWVIFILLCLASLLSVYSASGIVEYRYTGVSVGSYVLKHFLILLVGAFIVFVFHRWDYRDFERVSSLLFFLSIPLLLFTMFFGPEVNEARRWINIPVIGVSLQTSDVAKIALVMYLSKVLAFRQDRIKDFKEGFLVVMLPILVVCALILPSDLSTAAILFGVCMLLVFIGRVRVSHILLTFLVGAMIVLLIVLLGYMFPDFVRVETWQNRIMDFVSGAGNHDNLHAKIAIARGGALGVGPGNSIERNFIAYPYADFIFAIIVEEYGLVGALLVLLAYIGLMWRVVILVTASKKSYASFLILGLSLLVVVQALANMAVSLHIVPPTGLTLPIVSMGGTSVIFTCIAFGMILSVSHYIKMERLKAGASSLVDI